MNPKSCVTPKFAFLIPSLAIGLILLGFACGGGDGKEEVSPADSPAGDSSGSLDLAMGDNFFDQDGAQNPTIEFSAGAAIEIALTNDGAAIHNMRFAGEDNQFNTPDDGVSDPDIVSAGQSATLVFTTPNKTGSYSYQCDFHPTDMKGTVTIK